MHSLILFDLFVFVCVCVQWCSHCKTLTPTWNALAAEVTSSNLHVAKLDATTEVAQAKRFDVRAFPSVTEKRRAYCGRSAICDVERERRSTQLNTARGATSESGDEHAEGGRSGPADISILPLLRFCPSFCFFCSFSTIKLVSEGRVYTYEGPRSQTALSEFARSRGAGQSSTGVGEAPGQVAMAAERFLALAGDVQTVLMRKPLAGVAFVAVGLMAGVLLSLLVFAFCIDRTPQEFVRFTDETGVTRTVPYVRPPAIALMPVANAGAGGAPAAAAAASPAVKKAQ